VVIFDQKIDLAGAAGMALIIAGVVVLRVFSDASVD
jgi:multidrug transporter EmrE-like cation transporter